VKLNKLYYIFAFLFYLASTSFYVYTNYQTSKQTLIADLDAKLIQSALRVSTVIPENFHHVGMTKDEVSAQKDRENIKRLSVQAKLSGVEYMYSYIKQGDDILFTSSSATENELRKNVNVSHYFDVYDEEDSKLRNVFVSKKILFEVSSDNWGHFRSVLIPHSSSDGQFYVVGADIKVDFIDDELDKILKNSIVEIVFYIVILIPLFTAYFYHNKRNQALLEIEVKRRTLELKTLLDNSDQGFLSFSGDMLIHPEYSAKCSEIFQTEIEGKNIAELLFGEDETHKNRFVENIKSLIGDQDTLRVENILSLLHSEFTIAKKMIIVEYRRIGIETFMLIITDITEKIALEKRLEIEKNKLQMIVSAVEDSDELFDLLDDYREFISAQCELVKNDQTAYDNIIEIYRAVHTFKGLFAQKDFIMTPLGLYKLEEKLSLFLGEESTTNEQILDLLKKVELENWLERDLSILEKVLGEAFFDKKTREFLNDKSLFTRLSSYSKLVEKLSQKLRKHLYPMRIECDKNMILEDSHKPFVKSLVHIFRNCVDHGMESPEERSVRGKDEMGSISCAVTATEDGWEIRIQDDGMGINTFLVAQTAILKGILTQDEVDAMSAEAINLLIFHENFSTKATINDLSGRGMGLWAVKYELEAIGGTMSVVSSDGEGTVFIFFVPTAKREEVVSAKECTEILTPIAARTCSFLSEDMGIELLEKTFEVSKSYKLPLYPYAIKIGISGSINSMLIMGFETHALEDVAKFFIVDAQGETAYEFMKEQVACEVANTVLGNAIMDFPNKGAGVVITPPCMIGPGNTLFKNAHTNLCTTEIKTSSGSIMLALLTENRAKDTLC
jgi:two-component system chemotaxis sensor kinase CheA